MKDIRSDKTVKAQLPLSEKSLPGVRSTANRLITLYKVSSYELELFPSFVYFFIFRPKQTISSSKAHVIQSPAGYSLKTDQRAESRKEARNVPSC